MIFEIIIPFSLSYDVNMATNRKMVVKRTIILS